MERGEFLVGWLMLTTQPWGKAYRSTTSSLPGHEPSPAEIQQELYWKALQWVNPYVWEAVCEDFATGEHWPSITELKTSICHNTTKEPVRMVTRNPTIEWQSAPQPIRIILDYKKQHQVTTKDATLSVLPQWLTENPNHEDYADARLFLEKAQQNFGITTRNRGNINPTA